MAKEDVQKTSKRLKLKKEKTSEIIKKSHTDIFTDRETYNANKCSNCKLNVCFGQNAIAMRVGRSLSHSTIHNKTNERNIKTSRKKTKI